MEFFGSSNLIFESPAKENLGYKNVDQKYVGNVWTTYSKIAEGDSVVVDKVDVSSALKNWYAPFKGVKGE